MTGVDDVIGGNRKLKTPNRKLCLRKLIFKESFVRYEGALTLSTDAPLFTPKQQRQRDSMYQQCLLINPKLHVGRVLKTLAASALVNALPRDIVLAL